MFNNPASCCITMNKEDLKKLAADPHHIPGIYNYCDRWCERCPFTSRCLNFKMSAEKSGDQETADIDSAAFWENLAETLQETLNMLKEVAEERGIDLDSLSIESDRNYQSGSVDPNVIHLMLHMSKSYITMVDDWFDTEICFLENEEDQLPADEDFAGTSSRSEEETLLLKDSVEVIRWYQHQIYVKLKRAISSAQNEKTEILDEDDQKDSDGSAKVALVDIDRSMAAWGRMLKQFPDCKDGIFNIMDYLKRLTKVIETEFPQARSFIRPGFDETIGTIKC
jgi:hypothetical protein